MDVIKIKKELIHYPIKFSICTIVNNANEYEIMKKSFEEKGFIDNCEYLVADNTKSNEFDAYEAISIFLKIAKGEFLIIVHQDVRLIDNYEKLSACLIDLECKDNNWAICGNAGAKGYHQSVLHISHNSHKETSKNLPIKVNSLDENLLIIKSSSNITISPDLKGFHLYGTDLCIIAHFLGYTCYVIEFMLLHLSEGNISSLKRQESTFIEQYGNKMKIGYLQTTCTQFYLSNSVFKNRLLNTPFLFFIMKQFVRYPFLLKKWRGKL
jgi:hypothetical protein